MTPEALALLDENRALKLHLTQVQAQARAEMSSFTQALGHDLRAPVRHIRAFAQIIEEDFGNPLGKSPAQLPADLASHLKTIGQSAEQLAQMLDALVQLSRLSALEFKPDRVALGPLVNDLVPSFDVSASVAWQISKDLPDVQADAGMLRLILEQLISNAIKFSAKSADARVEIGWRPLDGGQVELFVADNGVGFDPRFQGQLFGIFQRLHAADQFAGLGAGLAMANRLVLRHGSQLNAKSAVGQGCEMRLTLPLATLGSI